MRTFRELMFIHYLITKKKEKIIEIKEISYQKII
jgi:hypothetical protein